MRIAFLELQPWEEKYLRERLDRQHEVVVSHGVLDDESLKEVADAEVLSPFIYSRLTAERLARLPKLKMIATRSTGFDHIDPDAITKVVSGRQLYHFTSQNHGAY